MAPSLMEISLAFFRPDEVTQLYGPVTAVAWRRNSSGVAGLVATCTAGETPAMLGYSIHSVPSSALRSPAPPKLRPTRLTWPLTSLVPKVVHISASGMWMRAMDDWFW